jgi:PKD repeat protein
VGPVANFTVRTNGLSVEVDGSESEDLNGNGIAEYIWDWGDGSNGTGEMAEHKYNKSGEYEITLRVINKDGQGNRSTQLVVLGKEEDEFNAMILLIPLILAMAAAIIAYLYYWKKKRESQIPQVGIQLQPVTPQETPIEVQPIAPAQVESQPD